MAGNAARNAAVEMRRQLVTAACQLLELPIPEYQSPEAPKDFFKQGERLPDFKNPNLGANVNYAADNFNLTRETVTAPDGRSLPYLEVIRKAMDFQGALQTKGVYISPKMGCTHKGAGAGLSPAYSFTAFITEVTVDPRTGFYKVDKVTCAHDCGKALNPLAVEGQLEGSIHMGLGQAMMEALVYNNGVITNPSFLEYKMLSPLEMPELDLIYDVSEDNEGPFGAKEVGEGALAPLIPSLANALYNAVGVRINNLPLTPDKVFKAIKDLKSEARP